jgi:hypothetical protein
MISRTMMPLVISYILLIGAGCFFLQAPPVSLVDSTYTSLLIVWSLFYIVGPSISLISMGVRLFTRVKHVTAWWHFEVSGLYLIVSANLVYSYALLRAGLAAEEYNLIAFSLVISAFASSFIGRIMDAYKLIRAVNAVTVDRKGA